MKIDSASTTTSRGFAAEEPHRHHANWWQWLLAIAALALPALGCQGRTEPPGSPIHVADGDTVHVDPAVQQRLGLEIVVAQEADITEPLIAPAVLQLDERHTARVGSPVEGRVREVGVQVGDRVSTGQVLAWIYSPAWEDVRARLQTAVATERSARAELDFAQQQVARTQRLWAAKAAARQEVVRARLDLVVARNKLGAARVEVARPRRELQQLAGEVAPPVTTLGLPLRTPIAGTVLEPQASPGQAVVPGTLLFTVADLERLWLLAEVDERALGRLQPGAAVEFSVVAYPNERFPAAMDYIGDQLDPKTRRVKVRCNVDNAAGRLPPKCSPA